MKEHTEEHINMNIELLDGMVGKVVRVSEKGYRVKINNEKIFLPLSQIKLKENTLFQKGERNLTGLIMQLQHCGPKVDDIVVKIFHKDPVTGNYYFSHSTGTGGIAPERCFKRLSSDLRIHIVDDNTILCDCCKNPFPHREIRLFYVPLKEWIRTGVLCENCYRVSSPILNLVKLRIDEVSVVPTGTKALKTFDKNELITLNSEVQSVITELATRHGILVEETHEQVRPTAMEYRVCFKLPSDLNPKKVKIEKIKMNNSGNKKSVKDRIEKLMRKGV